jgi:hypothetical protein
MSWLELVTMFAFVGVGALVARDFLGGSDESAISLFLVPALLFLSAPILMSISRDDRVIRKMLFAALAVKMLAAFARYFMAYDLYGGVADAGVYHIWGEQIAAQIRDLDFPLEIGRKVAGTGFIRLLTGIVYVFIGSSRFGGFLVYAWLGFWGLVLFFQAFRIFWPDASRRYAALVLFWPTVVFWTSSTGKDAWMVFVLGLAAYGAARVLDHRRGGFVFLALGLLGANMVRPHLAILVVAGVFAAYLVRRSRAGSSLGPLAKGAGIAVLLAVGVLVAGQVEEYLKLESVDSVGLDQALSNTSDRSSQGGSAFTPVRVRTPLHYPWAVVTVLYRPLPFEVRNAQMALTAVEGLALAVLTFTSRRRIFQAVRLVRNAPYVAMAAVYCAMFCFAFASLGNFGILARQRAQLLPLLLVLLAVPLTQPTGPPPAEAQADVPASQRAGRGPARRS